MGPESAIVRIEGEPFLSRARIYRDEMSAARRAWIEFAQKVGAARLSNAFGGFLFFGGDKPPADWKVPDRKGSSSPKKGSPDIVEILALPGQPSSRDIFGDSLVENLSYTGPDCHGSGSIGMFFDGPRVGYTSDGVFVAVIPHAGRAAARHLASHPDHAILHDADKWQLPQGLVEITQAEMDLLFAQDRVKQERAARVSDQAA